MPTCVDEAWYMVSDDDLEGYTLLRPKLDADGDTDMFQDPWDDWLDIYDPLHGTTNARYVKETSGATKRTDVEVRSQAGSFLNNLDGEQLSRWGRAGGLPQRRRKEKKVVKWADDGGKYLQN